MNLNLENPIYTDLEVIGTRTKENAVEVATAENTRLGVKVSQSGPKKAIELELLVPTRRNYMGSRTLTKVNLTGRQARELYETLTKFYETREDIEATTQVEWY